MRLRMVWLESIFAVFFLGGLASCREDIATLRTVGWLLDHEEGLRKHGGLVVTFYSDGGCSVGAGSWRR